MIKDQKILDLDTRILNNRVKKLKQIEDKMKQKIEITRQEAEKIR